MAVAGVFREAMNGAVAAVAAALDADASLLERPQEGGIFDGCCSQRRRAGAGAAAARARGGRRRGGQARRDGGGARGKQGHAHGRAA